jgi:hypothetical protein
MTSRNNFEVEGLKEFIKSINSAEGTARLKIKNAVDAGGDLLLAATKAKCGSQRIRSSLFLKREAPSGGRYTISNILTWGDDVRDFAAPYELGHNLVAWGKPTARYIQPRPFLRPAADENADKIFWLIENAIDDIVKGLGG